MADPLDEAAEVTEMLLQKALANKAAVPEKTGFCLTCEEPTPGAFCSKECRDDYEHAIKMKAIRGQS